MQILQFTLQFLSILDGKNSIQANICIHVPMYVCITNIYFVLEVHTNLFAYYARRFKKRSIL